MKFPARLLPAVRLLPLWTALLGPPAGADTVDARFPREPRHDDSVFVRMFPGLPPFAPQTDAVRAAAARLGAKDGPLDARDERRALLFDLGEVGRLSLIHI